MPSEGLALVGSGLKMRSSTAPARYAFRSTLFDLRMEWAEEAHTGVRIVSPYYPFPIPCSSYVRPVPDRNWNETRLAQWAREEGQRWAGHILQYLVEELAGVQNLGSYVALYTCEEMTRLLRKALQARGISHRVPLEGMNGGDQCHWLLTQIEGSLEPRR